MYSNDEILKYRDNIQCQLKAYQQTGLTPDNIIKMTEDIEEMLDCNDRPDIGKYCAFYTSSECRLKKVSGACIPKWRGLLTKEQIDTEIDRYTKKTI